jgi:predicted RNase H-like HicB family nuclease
MNTMTYKGYVAEIEYDAKDHVFVGHLIDIDEIVTFHGESVAELESELQTAVDQYLSIQPNQDNPPQKPRQPHKPSKPPVDLVALARAQGRHLADVLTDAIRESEKTRTKEESFDILVASGILDEEGYFSPKCFSEETVAKDRASSKPRKP